MEIALVKQSQEELWLKNGFFLLLQFVEGYVPFKITGREWANLKPFSLGDVATLSNLTEWNSVNDGQSRRYFEPHREGLIYHIFWGVNKPNARVYVQYGPRDDIGSVLSPTRTTTGDIGYISGYDSPYDGPYSIKTELFTIKERYPQFQVYNPLTDAMTNVCIAAEYMKYKYTILTDMNLVRQLVLEQRPVKKYTMGPIDPQKMSVPEWLKRMLPQNVDGKGMSMLDFTSKLIEEGS